MTPWDCVKTDQILLEKMSNGASVLCPCETHQHDTGAGATLTNRGTLQQTADMQSDTELCFEFCFEFSN